jgi:ketosteroid isomerase-like protein
MKSAFVRMASSRRMALWVLIAGTAALLSAPPAHADAASEIRAAQLSIATGAEARNLDAIMSNYLDSEKLFVFDVYPPRAYLGYDAFRKDWHDFLAGLKEPITYQMQDMDVDTDGKLGYVHVIEHIVSTDNAGKPVEINMRVTELYRKINGKWLIVHEHASVPVNIKTDVADVLSR